MKKTIIICAALLLITTATWAKKPIVELETNYGNIVLELNDEKAPVSVKNFLRYTNDGFYDNTIFHRVIKDFMIQGGGFEKLPLKKKTYKPIRNEAQNGLKNNKGTISMARTGEVHSGTSQFFINTKDNDFLNNTGSHPRQFGYAVFGRVIKGMDVVEKINKTPTKRVSGYSDVPEKEVRIVRARIIRNISEKKETK